MFSMTMFCNRIPPKKRKDHLIIFLRPHSRSQLFTPEVLYHLTQNKQTSGLRGKIPTNQSLGE